MQVIKPFEFLSEEEAKRRLLELEEHNESETQKMETLVKIEPDHRRTDYGNIHNDTNPFLNFCKKAFDFAKDNVSVKVSAMPFNKNIDVGDFVSNPIDKITIPKMTTTIGLGPFELNLNSNERDISLKDFKFKKGKGLFF